MNKYLLTKVPLSYDTLVIETTNQCNAKCGMCYQESGPLGSDRFGKGELPFDIVKRVLADATQIPTLGPRVHFSGGEVFLNLQNTINSFSEAKKNGFLEISATTNAFWGKNISDAKEIAKKLRAAGLTRIEISCDHWHLEYINSSSIKNCIIACDDADIEIVLRTLSSKSNTSAEALCHLDDELISCADEVVCCPIIPSGRAAKTIPTSDILFSNTLGSSCHHMLNLTVNAFGDVYPCCAGLDQNGNLKFGSIHKESIIDIAKWMNKSLLLRVLVFQGPGSFISILEKSGFNIGEKYNTICHLCWSIFSDIRKYNVINEYFWLLEKNRLLQVLGGNHKRNLEDNLVQV
jgi:sulfatase maturation enzyme AslB (radical SAM superfamily)